MEKSKGFIETLRRWVDGAESADPMDEISRSLPYRRNSEEFMVKIAKSIESVLQDELFVPPKGPALVPVQFIVFLNPVDNQIWRGSKRNSLEKALCEIIYNRALEMCEPVSLSVNEIEVCLREDRTLQQPSFRVLAVWDFDKELSSPNKEYTMPREEKTVFDQNVFAPVNQTPFMISKLPFIIEIWRNGQQKAQLNLRKTEISIGRGSSSTIVDVPLIEEPKVSRLHAILRVDDANKFWLTANGVNSTMTNGKLVQQGETVSINHDETMQICSYTLKLRVPEMLINKDFVSLHTSTEEKTHHE
ncbi:MAG: FHA domain-containing protein [Pyrinomonadaceae bacterium]|nr:FHA domain-containing protein [Pyrinomonadaceae bacterium]